MADNAHEPFKMFHNPEMFHDLDALKRASEYAFYGDYRQGADWFKNALSDFILEVICDALQETINRIRKIAKHGEGQDLVDLLRQLLPPSRPHPDPPDPPDDGDGGGGGGRDIVQAFRSKDWQKDDERTKNASFHTVVPSKNKIVGDEATWKPILIGTIIDKLVDPEIAYMAAHKHKHKHKHKQHCLRLVAIEGEKGTPALQVGEAIHALGIWPTEPFVAISLAGMAPAPIEEALFGREVPTSNGPMAAHEGAFEQANGGMVLIHDVETLPIPVQTKLLQAIQHGEVTRVGGVKAIPVNVCVAVASSQPFEKVMSGVTFPPEILQPPKGGRLVLPPLNGRLADICHKVYACLEEYNAQSGRPPVLGVDDRVLYILLEHDWTDRNDSGLEEKLKNAFPNAVGRCLQPKDLSSGFLPPAAPRPIPQNPRDEAIDLACFLLRLLAACGKTIEDKWAAVSQEWDKLKEKWKAMEEKECSIKEIGDYAWSLVRYNDVWEKVTNVRPLYGRHKKAANRFVRSVRKWGSAPAQSFIPEVRKRLQAIENLTAADFEKILEDIIAEVRRAPRTP